LENVFGGCNGRKVYISAFPDFREFKRHITKYLLSLRWERIEVRGDKPVMKDCLGNRSLDRS
jgi:hypothetical protein